MKRRRDYQRLLDLGLGGGARTDAEMDLEIETHVTMRVEDLIRAGMTPEMAREEALRRFGHFDTARRDLHTAARRRKAAMNHRDTWGSIVADVRYALRQVRRAPGFALLATCTLAMGLGATTAMFTLVEHVLLQPLPFADADRLVSLAGLDSAHDHVSTVSSADWQDWRRAGLPAFADIALSGLPYRQGLADGDSAALVTAAQVSTDYFAVLRPRFVAGHGFSADAANGAMPVVVVSERVWRTMLNADPALATPLRTLRRNYLVVGVIAAGQEYPAGTEAWFPVLLGPEGPGMRNNINWLAIGRLRPGATIAGATAQLGMVAAHIRAADPTDAYSFGVDVRSLQADTVGGAAAYLKLLMGVVGIVLLIVCANVAAAALGRTAARAREMAVRSALGAGRGRLIQQLLIEHVLLGLVGGLMGLGLAWMGVRVLLAAWGDHIPRSGEIALDAPIFAFAVVASLVAGAAAGLIPAFRLSRVSLQKMLASGGRGAARGGRNLAGWSLVATEIAMAVLLLTGAGLLIQSFRSLIGRGLGFTTDVATAAIGLPSSLYGADPGRRTMYWNQLIDSYRAIPGVRSAAVTTWLPLGMTGQSFIEIAGRNLDRADAVYRPVSEDFLTTLAVPLMKGRMLERSDDASSQQVAVINHRLAETYWPGEDPIGKQLRAKSMETGPKGEAAPWRTVVGVVGDVRTWGLEADGRPEMYVPFRQAPGFTTSQMTAVVRGDAPAAHYLGEMRKRARALEPKTAPELSTLDTRLRDGMGPRRMTLALLTGFAILALLLAALGIYGVLSYSVAQRTRELAVRAALGARSDQLLGLVMRSGLKVVAVGGLAGIGAGYALTRVISGMLVGVAATDPVSYAWALLALLLVAVAAIAVPARRAMRLDPIIALQTE